MPSQKNVLPPHDLEAERCFLGSISLNDNMEMVRTEMGRMEPHHFYDGSHRQVFTCLRELLAEGQPTDMVTVAHRMKRHGWWQYPETPVFLCEVIQCVPHAYHVHYYANIVIECWRRRRMVELGDWLYRRATDFSESVDDTWDRVGREVRRQMKLKEVADG